MLMSLSYFCSGCGQMINKGQVRELAGVGRMCKLCGSGRIVPIEVQGQENADSSNKGASS